MQAAKWKCLVEPEAFRSLPTCDQQKDYVEWFTEAKTDATREKRLAQAIEWMAEGKARHWKYENC